MIIFLLRLNSSALSFLLYILGKKLLGEASVLLSVVLFPLLLLEFPIDLGDVDSFLNLKDDYLLLLNL